MTAKELREKRAKILPELERLRDLVNEEGREWSAEDEASWVKVNEQYDGLTKQIEVTERAETAQAEQEAPAGDGRVGRDNTAANEQRGQSGATSERDRSLAFNAYVRAGTVGLSADHEEACGRLNFNPYRHLYDVLLPDTDQFANVQRAYRSAYVTDKRARAVAAFEERAMSSLIGSAGAYVVPETFIRNLEINKLAFSSILQVAEVMRTATGEPLHWPTADDTSNTGEIVGESASVDGSTDFTVGRTTWNAYKFHAKMIKVPVELLEDSAFDIASIIGQMLGERLGRISNTRFTTGTGAAQPKGITVGLTTGKTTASSTAIAADEILDLINSVDDAYLDGAGFMFEKNILLAVRKLKDGMGQYLWQPGMRGGAPDVLFNYPYTINGDMSSTITSTDITMLFGQLSAYKVRQVRGMRFVRLDERYAEYDQVAFDVFLRQDGHILDAGTAPLKSMVQA